MAIKEVVNMFFAKYEKISINVELSGGISGKYRTYTKEDFIKDFEGWLEETVCEVIFQTHYTCLGKAEEKLEIPILYIMYL